MKSYPKIPRHDIEFVPDDLFSADDLHLLEKVDGSNFRFMLYEERFADEYDDEIHEFDPEDGDVVFGTKSVIRGVADDPISSFDSDLQPALNALRDIRRDPIREAQDRHGPLVLFAEHMVPHTLDYEYESDPPPALIGFDVYSSREDPREPDDFPPNPYKERLLGFLPIKETRELFRRVGIERAPVIRAPEDINGRFDPSDFDVPQSQFGSVTAEGVVLRSDSLNARAKYVTEEFRELHKMSMGGNPSSADDPVYWLVHSLVTPARVRKHVRRLVTEQGHEFSDSDEFISLVTRTVLRDAWEEEFAEIRNLDSAFAPADAHEPATDRVRNVIERMKQMGARTDTEPTQAWTTIDDGEAATGPASQQAADAAARVERNVHAAVQSGVQPEEALLDQIVGRPRINNIMDSVVNGDDRELDTWVIEPTADRVEDEFWTNDTAQSVLWQLHLRFRPSVVRETIDTLVTEQLEQRGVEIPEGGASWEPSIDDAEVDSLGDMF